MQEVFKKVLIIERKLMKKILINRWVSIIVLLFFVMPLTAQEHPTEQSTEKKAEHPTTQKAEHPSEKNAENPAEHPDETSVNPLTKDDLAKAIADYVKSQSDKNEKFIVEDPKTGENLELTLLKVHKKRLSGVGDNLYFACADFKNQDGKVYDLDVFMEGETAEKLTFNKFSVHKEDNVERYGWQEEKGVWKKVDLK